MIAVAMQNNTPRPVDSLHDLLELIQRDYQISADDFAAIMEDFTAHYEEYPELRYMYDYIEQDVSRDRKNNQDGIYGDDYYVACEQFENAKNELKEVSGRLRSNTRKGNTKADIANDIDIIVSNMNGIL